MYEQHRRTRLHERPSYVPDPVAPPARGDAHDDQGRLRYCANKVILGAVGEEWLAVDVDQPLHGQGSVCEQQARVALSAAWSRPCADEPQRSTHRGGQQRSELECRPVMLAGAERHEHAGPRLQVDPRAGQDGDLGRRVQKNLGQLLRQAIPVQPIRSIQQDQLSVVGPRHAHDIVRWFRGREGCGASRHRERSAPGVRCCSGSSKLTLFADWAGKDQLAARPLGKGLGEGEQRVEAGIARRYDEDTPGGSPK